MFIGVACSYLFANVNVGVINATVVNSFEMLRMFVLTQVVPNIGCHVPKLSALDSGTWKGFSMGLFILMMLF